MDKYPSKKTVEAKLVKALNMLMKNDLDILKNDAHECSVSHRLAVYLEQEFPEWHVDCEYNRDWHNKNGRDSKRNNNSGPIRPDIIVHHRHTDDNLLAIEMKKYDSQDEQVDKMKLRDYRSKYKYKNGFYIHFTQSPIEFHYDIIE